uniref:Calcium-dependent protein kinase, isoform 2 n=1 Tax=Arundo donax TaxID=35708 RepID=A0A0A9G8F3_ARUDO
MVLWMPMLLHIVCCRVFYRFDLYLSSSSILVCIVDGMISSTAPQSVL